VVLSERVRLSGLRRRQGLRAAEERFTASPVACNWSHSFWFAIPAVFSSGSCLRFRSGGRVRPVAARGSAGIVSGRKCGNRDNLRR